MTAKPRQSLEGASRKARRLSLMSLSVAAILAIVGVGPAAAVAPWWQLGSEAAPTNLPPEGQAQIVIVATNLGDTPINSGESQVIITDKLPSGLVATGVEPVVVAGMPVECSIAALLTCKFAGTLNPYERIAIPINVKVEEPPGTVTTLLQEATVEGGGGPRASAKLPIEVSGEPTSFGVATYELGPSNEDGSPATQAGSHPFQVTTTLTLNQLARRQPVSLPKDLSFRLPTGLVGNPNSVAQCSSSDFIALVEETNLCPASSVVGVATVTANEPKYEHVFTRTVPVFNLVPSRGEPARLGFEVLGKVPVVIDTSVRTGKDYGVVATVKDATQTAGLLSSELTLWGAPGDPRHNDARGWECIAGDVFAKQAGKPCPVSNEVPQQPFLTLPTSCQPNPASEPLTSSMEADSWAQPNSFLSTEYAWMSDAGQDLGMDGCNQLPFTPMIRVASELHAASTPTGLSVNVELPQKTTLEANGLAEADVRDTTVTLPQGVELSPAAANGLEACSEAQIGFTGFNQDTQTNEFTAAKPSCPDGSKVGLVHIKTPLLSHELEGAVYLASPAPNQEEDRNPFNSLVALYIVAEDPVSGVLVKLAGEGQLNEGTLRVSTTFRNAPQLPFEVLKLDLFGGPQGSVSTPTLCGSYATEAAFTPWSGTGTVDVSSPAEEFNITSGANGTACSGSPLAFSPGFNAQVTNVQAGAFTNFQLELTRPDGDQALSAVSTHLPPGNAAMLSSVKLCDEGQANADACPAESQVGEAIAVAGLGSEPYTETGGRVYITGPYSGAPFGLEIVSPAVAGPFDLGTVTVRSKLFIDRNDASVTIVSDKLPTQLRGIPLQLKRVLVSVNRTNFEFNPTNCSKMRIEGSITGDQGAAAPVSSPFEVANCQSLPFKPKLTATTKGQASKANGANFDVKVESKGLGQANIAKVRLQLPQALPARLTTLQKACTEGVFTANPASCPEGSVIGQATIHTPVLSTPLRGPAYLVSHGGAAFPDVEFVLQGEGVTLVLDGKTQIKKQITYSKFEAAPDAPFTVFETALPAGPHSALTTNLPEKDKFNLCSSSLSMPTEIVGQNGAVLKQTTKIALQGCKKVKASRPLSREQLLKRALAACRKQHEHSKARREACEGHARKRYAANKAVQKPNKAQAHRNTA
jgi:hypothetical protein